MRKNLNSKFLLLTLLFTLLISCEKEPEIPDIVGTWNWVSSVGWGTLTPETDGHTKKIVFTDVIYSEFRDGLLEYSGAYYLTPEEDGSSSFVLLVDEYPYPLYLTPVSKDTIRISSGMIDAFIDTYVRE